MWKSRREAGKAMPRDRRAWATRGVASSVHCAVGATARSVPQSGHKRLGARSQSGRDGRWLHQGWVHSTMGYPCRARSVARGLITCCWVWPPPHALSCVGQSRLLCGEGGGGRVGCEEKNTRPSSRTTLTFGSAWARRRSAEMLLPRKLAKRLWLILRIPVWRTPN